MLVYSRRYDWPYFVPKIVIGHRKEIRRAIHMHKPSTVDDVLSLAETQE